MRRLCAEELLAAARYAGQPASRCSQLRRAAKRLMRVKQMRGNLYKLDFFCSEEIHADPEVFDPLATTIVREEPCPGCNGVGSYWVGQSGVGSFDCGDCGSTGIRKYMGGVFVRIYECP